MTVESEKPNEKLAANLYNIARDLSDLWDCFTNTAVGFAGGGSLDGNVNPEQMAQLWVGDVKGLLEGCSITSEVDEDWGRMIVMLYDLTDELTVYWGPFWKGMEEDEQLKILIRMDMFAQGLLEIYRSRGYITAEYPFDPPDQD